MRVLSGEVVYGDQRGRLLGFPTANMRIAQDAAIPFGVYAGRLEGNPAAISVGVRPTFGTGFEPLLEAHVLDFAGDLYGRTVRVELLRFLRREQSFEQVEALVEQIEDDVRQTRAVVGELDDGSIGRVKRVTDALAGGSIVLLDGSAVGDGASQMVVAAEHADAAVVNRMATDARGLVALAMTASHCAQLGLSRQSSGRHADSDRTYTLSIEARRGVTTGISAEDRAVTVAAAIAPDATPHDVVVPGHVFPVTVADGGVLEDSTIAAAGVDLARIAGLSPAAVCCEILDDGGDVADGEHVASYGTRAELPVVSVTDVIAYRRHVARRKALVASRQGIRPARVASEDADV